jgi:predicted nuclease of restriction endonuclease-like (RecB) superfamily
MALRNRATPHCPIALGPGGNPARQLPRARDRRLLRPARRCRGLDAASPADDDHHRLHERTRPALTNFDRAIPEPEQEAIRDIVKDPYILDFLAADPVRERDLSKALTDNLTRFLRELGSGFAFVGAEVPIPCGDREFYVDLLFYHCRLHRYVVFEWKLGRFEPEHVGKLNFYVQLVDDHLRDQTCDGPTLGMLLFVGRDDVTVEVALRGVSTPLAVTE